MSAKIRCLTCLDVLQSQSRHDYRSCTCGDIFVDGGDDYLRMGTTRDGARWEDVSVRPVPLADDPVHGWDKHAL